MMEEEDKTNNMSQTRQKLTKGKRKIEIKKIESKASRQVTFSKRRGGIFKKAGELSVLCGAEVAVIALSAKQKVFSFGHPSVDSVVDRFTQSGIGENMENTSGMRKMEELKLLDEKKRDLEKTASSGCDEEVLCWWNKDVERMGFEELQEFVEALEALKIKVEKKLLVDDNNEYNDGGGGGGGETTKGKCQCGR